MKINELSLMYPCDVSFRGIDSGLAGITPTELERIKRQKTTVLEKDNKFDEDGLPLDLYKIMEDVE